MSNKMYVLVKFFFAFQNLFEQNFKIMYRQKNGNHPLHVKWKAAKEKNFKLLFYSTFF
jgi:hypothetical protein